MTLKNCRECGSDDVETCSGDAVLCLHCGNLEPFNQWQMPRVPITDEDFEMPEGPANDPNGRPLHEILREEMDRDTIAPAWEKYRDSMGFLADQVEPARAAFYAGAHSTLEAATEYINEQLRRGKI